MTTVATLHGIWGKPGYAEQFFRLLRPYGSFQAAELHWPEAWLGPAALPLLRIPAFRARQEAELAALFAQVRSDNVVLVTHSAGCPISAEFLARHQWPVKAYWTMGCFARLMGFDAPLPLSWSKWTVRPGAEPELIDRLTMMAATLGPRAETLPRHVAWTNAYYVLDPLGQALAPWGAECRDLELSSALHAIEDHSAYWTDDRLIREVAGSFAS